MNEVLEKNFKYLIELKFEESALFNRMIIGEIFIGTIFLRIRVNLLNDRGSKDDYPISAA